MSAPANDWSRKRSRQGEEMKEEQIAREAAFPNPGQQPPPPPPPAHPVHPAQHPVQPAPAAVAYPAHPVQPVHPVHPAHAVQPAHPVHPAAAAYPAHPVHPAQHPVHPAQHPVHPPHPAAAAALPPRLAAPAPPQGYYQQPMYAHPPVAGEAQPAPAAAAYPPPRGYEAAGYPPQYSVPPPGYPYMPPYGMYPPYQHPGMYGGPPPPQQQMQQGPPPPYGYQDPNLVQPRYAEQDPGAYGGAMQPQPREPDDRKMAPRSDANSSVGDDDDDDDDGDDSSQEIVPGAVTARLKTYIKPRIPSTQEVLDRRSRKNAQSRARAAKLRHRISDIETKPEDDRTEEEKHLWAQYESRRQRKNDRSRERALEKKEEIDRILAKPDKKRTKIERQFLETALSAKKRKNEGDRLRRQRLKELGFTTKGSGVKPGISARGPLPPQYQHLLVPPPGYMQMGDIPMSPLPTMPPQHHHFPMQSPGFGSPGMQMGMGFPSPGRRHLTPGRGPEGMPYFPAAQMYEQPSPGPRGQPPMNSRVEQRRNPDGSMSIQIGGQLGGQPLQPQQLGGQQLQQQQLGGQQAGGAPFVGGTQQQGHMGDVSNMLLEQNDGGYAEQQAAAGASVGRAPEEKTE